MDARQLTTFVIGPTLEFLDPEIPLSRAAVRLVLGTALHESAGLRYIDQLSVDPARPGPAYGLWQMEARTLADHWSWVHERDAAGNLVRPALAAKIEELVAPWPPLPRQLHGNLYFGCAMCRVHYWRAPEAMPGEHDIEAMARLWKLRYNSEAGAGTISQGEIAMNSAMQYA